MPFDSLPAATGLATTAYARLLSDFATFNHRPSDQQLAAIAHLLETLELAAQGRLDTALHLSAIPAGTGKTTALAAFAEALMASPDHDGVGILITVNRIAEAADLAERLAQHRSKVCVITSDANANDKGAHATASEAQVCISTQAALKATIKALAGAPFADATRFHYRGKRRAVVCWDESFAFNRPVVLDADTVLGLAKAMRRQSDDAATMLVRWSADVNSVTGLCTVPDFEGMGVDFGRLEDDVGDRDELVSQVKALAVVSGDEGYVSRQGGAAAVVTHYPEIPRNLLPVVVTDASAKVNPSYAQMARKVPVRWLKDAPKTYQNLTLRVVNTAASRSVYRDVRTTRARDLLDIVSRYVAATPAGLDVLVVGYKGRFSVKGVNGSTLEEALRNRLRSEDVGRVRYLAYGHHTATNDYAHVQHVVLLGLNFVPKAAGHAASGAALDLNLKNEHPTEDQIRATQRGMLMDSTLQALLRGNARMGVFGDCGKMEAVILQTKQTGLSEADYRLMFPEVVLVQDRVLMPSAPLKGRLGDLSSIVLRRLQAGETEMTNQSLYAELGMSKSNFGTLVKKPEWQAFVAENGLRPQRLPGRSSGLKVMA